MKMKYIALAALAVLIVVGGLFLWKGVTKAPGSENEAASAGYENATYTVEGKSVTLADGSAVSELAPGSASKLVTHYFGNEAGGDLNGDGVPDAAFLLTQTGGGSGTFYYVAAALKTANGYEGTNAIFLGDRIAPQTTAVKDGEITVNYADRNPDEPMTTAPSVGVSRHFRVEGGALIEIGGQNSS